MFYDMGSLIFILVLGVIKTPEIKRFPALSSWYLAPAIWKWLKNKQIDTLCLFIDLAADRTSFNCLNLAQIWVN